MNSQFLIKKLATKLLFSSANKNTTDFVVQIWRDSYGFSTKILCMSQYMYYLSKPTIISKKFVQAYLFFLKKHTATQYKQCIDIAGIDTLSSVNYKTAKLSKKNNNNKCRFIINYILFSTIYNSNFILQVQSKLLESLPTITSLYSSTRWLEREVWDMFGIRFQGHSDLRRILTDYGFNAFPLRKDFPLSGFEEIYYSDHIKRVIYEPIVLMQEYRTFTLNDSWDFLSDSARVQIWGNNPLDESISNYSYYALRHFSKIFRFLYLPFIINKQSLNNNNNMSFFSIQDANNFLEIPFNVLQQNKISYNNAIDTYDVLFMNLINKQWDYLQGAISLDKYKLEGHDLYFYAQKYCLEDLLREFFSDLKIIIPQILLLNNVFVSPKITNKYTWWYISQIINNLEEHAQVNFLSEINFNLNRLRESQLFFQEDKFYWLGLVFFTQYISLLTADNFLKVFVFTNTYEQIILDRLSNIVYYVKKEELNEDEN